MTRVIALVSIFVLLVWTSACSVLPAQAPLPQRHDFGPLPAVGDDPAVPLRVVPITAPAWLSDDAIHYRLLYSDPTAFRSYADNRWASPPAELLGAGLQFEMSSRASAQAESGELYELDATLVEFEQDFSTPKDATVRLVLHVSMRRPSDGRIVAEQRFVKEQASSPDVQGAVTGLAQLAKQAEAEIAAWVQAQAPK